MAQVVYDLKSVGALKIEFIAPIPEQTGTPTMHFSNVSGGVYQKLPARKLGRTWSFWKNVKESISPKFSAGNF